MDMSARSSAPYTPRPGEPPRVSPEGIIYGTDGKCRWVYEPARRSGPFRISSRCLLFTMDESSIHVRRVKGRARKDEVIHAFAVWVGGQSQPALRFQELRQVSFHAVRRIIPEPARSRIRLRGTLSSFFIQAEPQQFEVILSHLARHCPQAALDF